MLIINHGKNLCGNNSLENTNTILPCIKDKTKYPYQWAGCACLLLHKDLNLGWIFDTAGCRASSRFYRVHRFFDVLNVNVENITSHKYIVQSGRSMFRAISESVGTVSYTHLPLADPSLFGSRQQPLA